jgi:Putative MetA-pathway of phenol degradation
MRIVLTPALTLVLVFTAFAQQNAKGIQDNSFLIEEAYNQDLGVVQHISEFQRSRYGGWIFTFAQEWPMASIKHQLSFTLPVLGVSGQTGLGDIAVNYRYQLVGDGDAKFAMAPRFSVLFPSGDEKKELGVGGMSLQVNIPVSIVLHPKLVTHWNAGTTFTPSARNAAGVAGSETDFNLGQSFIWLAHERFNVMMETAFNRFEMIEGRAIKSHASTLFLNPGVRWAYNFRSGLQIVPGIAFPVGVGPSSGNRGVFLYLSFEHPFHK